MSEARAFYDLQRVRTDYTGYTFEVRRSSDNAQSNFTCGITLDVANCVNDAAQTLTTWRSSANVFIVTWFDQSNNGRHAQRTSAPTQPQLITASNVISFAPTAWYLDMPDGTIRTGSPSAFTIFTRHGTFTASGTRPMFGTASATSNQGFICGIQTTGSQNSYRCNFNGGSQVLFGYPTNYFPGADSNSQVASVVAGNTITMAYDGTRTYTYMNGQTRSSVDYSSLSTTAGGQFIGRDSAGNYFQGQTYSLYVFGSGTLAAADIVVAQGYSITNISRVVLFTDNVLVSSNAPTMNSRANSNAYAATVIPSGLTCTNVFQVLSYSTTDTAQMLPGNLGFYSYLPIFGRNGNYEVESSGSYSWAFSFGSFLNLSPFTMQYLTGISGDYWTGISGVSNARVNEIGSNCNAYTSTASATATIGLRTATGATAVYSNTGNCNTQYYRLFGCVTGNNGATTQSPTSSTRFIRLSTSTHNGYTYPTSLMDTPAKGASLASDINKAFYQGACSAVFPVACYPGQDLINAPETFGFSSTDEVYSLNGLRFKSTWSGAIATGAGVDRSLYAAGLQFNLRWNTMCMSGGATGPIWATCENYARTTLYYLNQNGISQATDNTWYTSSTSFTPTTPPSSQANSNYRCSNGVQNLLIGCVVGPLATTTRSPTSPTATPTAVTAAPTSAAAGLILYASDSTSTGNMGNRATTSAVAATEAAAFGIAYRDAVQMLSYSGDTISNFATTYLFDASQPVYLLACNGCPLVQVASSWTNFLAGTLTVAINSAVYVTGDYWTGADNTNTCSGWTSASSGVSGRIGSRTSTTSTSLSLQSDTCNNSRRRLYLAIQGTRTPTKLPTKSPTAAPASASELLIWASPSTYTGATVGDRATADAICVASAPPTASGADIPKWAVVSYTNDALTSAPTYFNFPSSAAIYAPSGARVSANFPTFISNSPTSLDMTLASALGITASPTAIWTGTTSTGTLSPTSCSGFTTASPASTGTVGASDVTSGAFLSSSTSIACNNAFRILCMASLVPATVTRVIVMTAVNSPTGVTVPSVAPFDCNGPSGTPTPTVSKQFKRYKWIHAPAPAPSTFGPVTSFSGFTTYAVYGYDVTNNNLKKISDSLDVLCRSMSSLRGFRNNLQSVINASPALYTAAYSGYSPTATPAPTNPAAPTGRCASGSNTCIDWTTASPAVSASFWQTADSTGNPTTLSGQTCTCNSCSAVIPCAGEALVSNALLSDPATEVLMMVSVSSVSAPTTGVGVALTASITTDLQVARDYTPTLPKRFVAYTTAPSAPTFVPTSKWATTPVYGYRPGDYKLYKIANSMQQLCAVGTGSPTTTITRNFQSATNIPSGATTAFLTGMSSTPTSTPAPADGRCTPAPATPSTGNCGQWTYNPALGLTFGDTTGSTSSSNAITGFSATCAPSSYGWIYDGMITNVSPGNLVA